MESPSESVLAIHDSDAMKATFQQHLVAPGTSTQIQECRITNRRHLDGSCGTVQYDVRLANSTTGRTWNQMVTGIRYEGDRTRRIWDSIRLSAALEVDPKARSAMPPFAYVPELDVLLQVFPHDHRLPGLARLIAGPPPELLLAILAGFGPGEWQLAKWHAKSVRYRPAVRAAVRVRVRAGDEATGRVTERRTYAKVYSDPQKARLGAQAQRELYDRVAAEGASFVVAEPIAYDSELLTVVQGEVAGTSLQTLLQQENDPTSALRAAARSVAQFHQLAASAPPRRARKSARPLRNGQEWLRSARPDLARTVAGILEAVAVGLGGVAPVPTHGDLRPQHVLLDGDHVALIDFDDLAEGDPLRDIAIFVAQLAQIRSDDRATTAVGVFLKEYLAHVPATWRSRLPNITR